MEGRWVTINGAKVFINDKGDVIMGMGKGGSNGLRKELTDTKGNKLTVNKLDNGTLYTSDGPFYRKPEWDEAGKEAWAMADSTRDYGYLLEDPLAFGISGGDALREYFRQEDFMVSEASGWPSNWKWTQGMRKAAPEYRKEVMEHSREISKHFLSDFEAQKSEAYDIDTYVGYQGRTKIEERKFFRETNSSNWRRKVGDNYCATIALYNNTAKYYEAEYKRSIKFGDPVDTIVRNRVAANIASNYAKQVSNILEEWDKDKDY